ncbi:hypothetical protein GW17_00029594 [Ensete ventricosum]|nr:hypothetical protein GW17_00029594 [Ensete ventricosum]
MNLRELAVDVLVFRWCEANQQSTFELPPCGNSMSILKPVIPLDRVSLEVYYNDVYHGCIWSLVIAKISFHSLSVIGRGNDLGKKAIVGCYLAAVGATVWADCKGCKRAMMAAA